MKARCVMKLSHLQAILFPVTLKLGQGYPTTITPISPPPRYRVYWSVEFRGWDCVWKDLHIPLP